MPRLEIHRPDGTVHEAEVVEGFPCNVGRDISNSVVLVDPQASRYHFRIDCVAGRWIAKNLSKTHGTHVDGQRVREQELHDGAAIDAGATRLYFRVAAELTASDEARRTVVFSADAEAAQEVPLGTSDPSRTNIGSAFEEALGDSSTEDLRRRFRLLQNLGQQMVSQLRLESLLDFILAKIFDVLPADHGVVLLKEPGTGELAPKAVRHRDGKTAAQGAKLHVSRTLVDRVMRERIGILSADAQADANLGEKRSILALGIRSVMCVPLVLQGQALGVLHVDSESSRHPFVQADLDLLTMLASHAALCVHNARLHDQIVREEMLRASLERYFSPAVARKIASHEIELDTGGTSVEATILYSDIRGFTALSEASQPDVLVRSLNEYFTAMTDLVFECGGSLDKFIGDALVAVFGSPLPNAEAPYQAARCAQRMMETLERMTFPIGPVRIGIGLHRGRVIHGNFGSQKVMQYTVIGDTVNTAARLCEVAQPRQIILSGAMIEAVGSLVEVRPLGSLALKGKSVPMDTFELVRCL